MRSMASLSVSDTSMTGTFGACRASASAITARSRRADTGPCGAQGGSQPDHAVDHPDLLMDVGLTRRDGGTMR